MNFTLSQAGGRPRPALSSARPRPSTWYGRVWFDYFGTPELKAAHLKLIRNTLMFTAGVIGIRRYGTFFIPEQLSPEELGAPNM
jgi:hypothetical protein